MTGAASAQKEKTEPADRRILPKMLRRPAAVLFLANDW
jgi:hypothetical protein